MRLAILSNIVGEAERALWERRLGGPLRTVGIEVELTPFTDELDLRGFQAATPLLAWGFHERIDLWSRRLDDLELSGLPVLNAVAALRWNTRKTYLAELAAAGAIVVPTRFVEELTGQVLEEAREQFSTPLLVVKPAMVAGAARTVRLAPGDPLDEAPQGAVMLQPYLPAIIGEGEISLVYFGGRFSHAVVRLSALSDVRALSRMGGAARAVTSPSPEALAVAEGVLAACPHPLHYARVDLIRGLDGGLMLMELQVIEPELFLECAADDGAAFAAAFAKGLQL